MRSALFANVSCEGDHPAGCLPPGEWQAERPLTHSHPVSSRSVVHHHSVGQAQPGRRRQEPTAWLQIRIKRLLCAFGG